ncbi:hypothetical protein [Nocardia brasiliensis]|uniref:hypothetical protein n=1 Tax=Nocardia brasiliensis TaxID=37326 RepID=UPI00245821EB|nr:hypothetical protein [Nocardia brasiliensis]
MIVVPSQFAEQLVAYEGPRATTWLRSTPALAEEFAQRWQLTPDGPLMHGVVGLALPVTTADGENRRTESTLEERFAAVIDGAGLDADRARAWTLVRAVRNWLDFLAMGDLTDDGYLAVRGIAPWALG